MNNKSIPFAREDRFGALSRIFRVVFLRGRLIVGVLLGNLRPFSALPDPWKARYRRARKDLWNNDSSFLPSRQWTIISWFYRLVFRSKGVGHFKSTFGRFLSTYEPDNPWIFQGIHHLYFNAIKKIDTWDLLSRLEEPILGEGSHIDYKGQRLSLDFLQSLDEFYRLQTALQFKREEAIVFCEVGAGYGRLAHVVLSAMPNATYLIFDLPESLILSQFYLSTLNPQWKTSFYPESQDVFPSPANIRAHRLVFGLPHQLLSLPKNTVNAFINIYSFMEMGRAQIDTYFNIIENLNPEILYMKQHKKEVNIFDQALNTQENYPVRPSWKKIYSGDSLLFEHIFESIYQIRPSAFKGR